jgi:hypothetical protein
MSLEPAAEAPKRPKRKAKGKSRKAAVPEEFEMVTYSGGKIVERGDSGGRIVPNVKPIMEL